MATEKTPNFTVAQEKIISDFAGTGANGALNLNDAKSLAAMSEMNDAEGEARNYRSIVAKIGRMGLAYEKKAAVRKDGTAVETKAKIVAQIAERVKGNLDGLDKAPRDAVVAIRDFLFTAAA